MTTTFIGTTFPSTYQWHDDEVALVNNIQQQIDLIYSNDKNILINTTWFGPQFDNGEYDKILKFAQDGIEFDNLFLIAAADPTFVTDSQIKDIATMLKTKNTYLLGHFDTEYYFNFHSTVLPKYFKSYLEQDLLLKDIKYTFLNYNRKPRPWRVNLAQKILNNNLKKYGIVTLGKNDKSYSGMDDGIHLLLDEEPNDYAKEGNWGMEMTFGIPHDIHSLGNMNYWQNHFLTIVSETEFNPWDNMFISEKTWKPVLGLRPFVINGQTKIYKYLRDNGFKTFNQYFPVELENISELEIQNSIIDVLTYLIKLSDTEIKSMYDDMLPALKHNRERFFEFSKEQQYKINNIFNG